MHVGREQGQFNLGRRRFLQSAGAVTLIAVENTPFMRRVEKTFAQETEIPKYDAPFIFNYSDRNLPFVYATYDDGGDVNAAVATAEIFAANGQKASFGPTLNAFYENPEKWMYIFTDLGMGIFDHSISHLPFRDGANPQFYNYNYLYNEFAKPKQVFEDKLGIHVGIARMPYGFHSSLHEKVCQDLGLKIMGGTVDSSGYTHHNSQDEDTYRTSARGVVNGGIIVAHCWPTEARVAQRVIDTGKDANGSQALRFISVQEGIAA